MIFLFVFAFLAGIFTVLSPCILPILPIILSAGTSGGRWRPFGVILGLVASFSFFTLSLTALVQATGLSPNILRYAAILLISLFGLVMISPGLSAWFAKITAPIAQWGQRVQGTEVKTGFGGGFFLGIALGLLWTPCAGPILAAITTIVATQAINLSTIFITIFYSVGAGLPMLLIAYGSNKIIQSSKHLTEHLDIIRKVFGYLMLLAALSIAFHWDMVIQQQITRFFPPVLIEDNALVKHQLEKLQNNHKGAAKLVFETDKFSNFGKAPELNGIVNWINSPPLSLMQLKGKVVLLDFWTYSCINCLRTLPEIEKLYAEYKEKGLVVIGVHTPEFEFEKEPKNVADAASRLGVVYPIAQDNDYKTWIAYNNHYWPAHYLIDQNGDLRMVHFGEGGSLLTENSIRELLGLAPLHKEGKKAATFPLTPETYLGIQRGKSYTSENRLQLNQIAQYNYQKPLENDQVGLKGNWKIEEERITAESNESYLDLNFLAKHVYLVLSGSSKIPLKIYLDTEPPKELSIDGNREYTIVDTSYGRHRLSIKIPPGISAYAFTFGN